MHRSLVCIALALLAIAGSAVSAQEERRLSFDIPAQPLAAALLEFSQQSHVQLVVANELTKGIDAPAIRGVYALREALDLLLKDSGLAYTVTADHTIAIGKAEPGRQGPDPGKGAGGGGRKSIISQAAAAPADSSAVEEVVVTAQKREERLSNVPISISVVNGSDLDRSTASGVTEVLASIPGVATQRNYLGGGTVAVIRGVAPSFPAANGASPVAYYLDSVPVGLVRSALGPDQSAYDLARVEVLRGPQGTLYGASALNGVVRVLTHDADLHTFDLKARVADSGTQYGGNNYRGDVAVNVPVIDDVLAVRAVAGYEKESGWIDQPNASNVNDSQLKSLRLKVNAQPLPDLAIAASVWSSREQASAPSIGYSFDRSEALLEQPLKTDFDAYNLRAAYQFDAFSISSATSYFNYSNIGNLDLLPFDIPGSIFSSGIDSHVFAEEVNLNSTLTGAWRWSAGAIYRRATENNLQTFSAIDVPPELVELLSKSYAVYGELTRMFFDGRLEATLGLRHFHDDISQVGQFGAGTPLLSASSTAEANTPRAVLTWHPATNVLAYASYQQGFRSGFPQDPTVPAGFAGVRPDRLRNYELGSKGTFMDARLGYDVSVYYMKWQGIQQSLTVPYQDVTTQAIVNGEGASGVGTDVALSVEPLRDLKLQVSASWNNLAFDRDVVSGGLVLFRKGERTTSSPELTGQVSAQYTFPVGVNGYRGMVDASVAYTSTQAYRGFVGSTLSDLEVDRGDPMTLAQIRLALLTPTRFTPSLFVDNLTNERGAPVRAFVGVRNWDARVRPRTVGVQLEYALR